MAGEVIVAGAAIEETGDIGVDERGKIVLHGRQLPCRHGREVSDRRRRGAGREQRPGFRAPHPVREPPNGPVEGFRGRLAKSSYKFASPSTVRHKYQQATVQYGLQAAAIFSISAGVGSSARP
jgi:hypothetical protein